jgi:RNA polymerase sigma-70 factor, ECF subfamily
VNNPEHFRDFLKTIARMQLNPGMQSRSDASDIVQETLLNAHRALGQFRGTTDAEMVAWLKVILANTLAHFHRDQHRDKRDISREQNMQAAVNASSFRLERILHDDIDSPSEQAVNNERIVRIATVLEQLPEMKREAIELHYWHSWTLDVIAEHQGRSRSAVAGDIYRGLKILRSLLDD